jgi:zinc transport system substrate-binding protein
VQPLFNLVHLAWLPLALCLCVPTWAAQRIEPMAVSVSIPPLRTLVSRVGGPYVRVQPLLDQGADPQHYEPSPERVADLAAAKLYVGTNAPFEAAWTKRLRKASPRLPLVNAEAGVAWEGEAADPEATYLWLSPRLAKQMTWRVRDALIDADPAHAAVYRSRAATYAADLDSLDRELRDRLAPVAHRRFLAAPPEWGAFAAAYGLVQVPVDGEGLGSGEDAVRVLIGQIDREGARLILMSAPPAGVDGRVARRTPARIYSLDPLASDTFEVLRRFAGLMVDGDSR